MSTAEINMDDQKRPSKNRLNRPAGGKPRAATRISGYLAKKPKPIKAARVDPDKERSQRLMWWLKWVIVLPLSVYGLFWILVILIDLFNY